MPQHLRVAPHFTVEELEEQYRMASDSVLRSHLQVVLLTMKGFTSQQISDVTTFSLTWLRTILRRYNAHCLEQLGDTRHANKGQQPIFTDPIREELRQRLHSPPPDGGLWTGPKVVAWVSERTGHSFDVSNGSRWIRELGGTIRSKRPTDVRADPVRQEEFKKTRRRHRRTPQRTSGPGTASMDDG